MREAFPPARGTASSELTENALCDKQWCCQVNVLSPTLLPTPDAKRQRSSEWIVACSEKGSANGISNDKSAEDEGFLFRLSFAPCDTIRFVAAWCAVTVFDPDGRRHSLDVLADSSNDVAHLFFVDAKTHRGSGLPIPTATTAFEVVANGRIYKVMGATLRDWIQKERTRRKGPRGYMFSKRPENRLTFKCESSQSDSSVH